MRDLHRLCDHCRRYYLSIPFRFIIPTWSSVVPTTVLPANLTTSYCVSHFVVKKKIWLFVFFWVFHKGRKEGISVIDSILSEKDWKLLCSKIDQTKKHETGLDLQLNFFPYRWMIDKSKLSSFNTNERKKCRSLARSHDRTYLGRDTVYLPTIKWGANNKFILPEQIEQMLI